MTHRIFELQPVQQIFRNAKIYCLREQRSGNRRDGSERLVNYQQDQLPMHDCPNPSSCIYTYRQALVRSKRARKH